MKSYSKVNREKIRAHILDHYERAEDDGLGRVELLKMEREAAREPRDGDQAAAMRLVEGGNFLIYYGEQREFIEGLNLSDTGKQYDDAEVWEKYKHLLAREINNLIKEAEA